MYYMDLTLSSRNQCKVHDRECHDDRGICKDHSLGEIGHE